MTVNPSTAAISGVLLNHGILRSEMSVRTARYGGTRTAVCLFTAEAVTLAARQRAEIGQALDEAGYLVVRWEENMFWAEPKWVAERRRQTREALGRRTRGRLAGRESR